MSNEQVSSVTIIAPDAMTADAMTKPVCLLPEEKAMSLVEALPQVEAIVMTPDRTRIPGQPGTGSLPLRITKTPGAERFIVRPLSGR
jgi:thiamine biosynthesis lipoprotein ApbE